MTTNIHGASFRDPSGFIFLRNGVLYRQINQIYANEYTRMMNSGLYENLVKNNLLIPHTEKEISPAEKKNFYKIIYPERVPFISYPYEWSFSQLKDAALATLSIQKRALKAGMSLKDASAYNIQFYNGKATLIDSLSFENYQDGEPWVAYRQFCQHFLAPLALMSYRDIRLNQLLRIHIDGIPLDLASRLLPRRTYFILGLYTNIHLHALAQQHYADATVTEIRSDRVMKKKVLLALLNNLERTIRNMVWKEKETEWGDYYEASNYTENAFNHKKFLISEWSGRIHPRLVWDFGANIGIFTRLATNSDGYAIAFDIDPLAVERNWRQVREKRERNILPLVMDITNPSPALGWDNRERDSLSQRGPAELVLALAIIHHLAISSNLPFNRIVESLAKMGEWLIIEFVQKTDMQVQKLLRNRKDIFDNYRSEVFETEFNKHYNIIDVQQLNESGRWMYLMKKKG